jgi:hypothetical protein
VFIKRGKTAAAQVTTEFAANNNMNPLYEGMQHFDNPLYDAHDFDTPVDDDADSGA